MAKTNQEIQRDFKARMYSLGFRQKVTWVKDDDPSAPVPIDYKRFLRELRKTLGDMRETELNELFAELLRRARKARIAYDATEKRVDEIVKGESSTGEADKNY